MKTISLLFEWSMSYKPTKCSCHIDIQFFTILDWHCQGHLELEHIPGIVNPANDLIKALGWVLYSCHAILAGDLAYYDFYPSIPMPFFGLSI